MVARVMDPGRCLLLLAVVGHDLLLAVPGDDLRELLVVLVVDDERGRRGRPGTDADRRQRRASVVIGLLARVHRVVEPAQLRRQHLDGARVPASEGRHEVGKEPQLRHEPRAHDEVGVGPLEPGVRVGLEHRLQRAGRSVGDERREVVGRVRHLGVLPPGQPPDAAGRGVGVVREHGEHLVAGEVTVRRRGGEAPQADVLERGLPPGEQRGRHPAGLGREVEVGEAAGAVGVGVVARQPGLLEDRGVGVVQGGDRPPQLGGDAGPRRQLGEVEVLARQVRVHGGTAALGERHETPWRRHGEGQATSEQREQRDGPVHLGARDVGAGRPHHPGAVLGIPDEGDVEGLVRGARQRLDAHRVEPGDRRARERGEEGGAAVHGPTVCRGPRLRWDACPVPTRSCATSR
jgi:hypothetical protein